MTASGVVPEAPGLGGGQVGAVLLSPLLHSYKSSCDYNHFSMLRTYEDHVLGKLYADQDAWAGKAILNVAGSGKFSSDRAIAEYATGIWELKPCPVS